MSEHDDISTDRIESMSLLVINEKAENTAVEERTKVKSSLFFFEEPSTLLTKAFYLP